MLTKTVVLARRNYPWEEGIPTFAEKSAEETAIGMARCPSKNNLKAFFHTRNVGIQGSRIRLLKLQHLYSKVYVICDGYMEATEWTWDIRLMHPFFGLSSHFKEINMLHLWQNAKRTLFLK